MKDYSPPNNYSWEESAMLLLNFLEEYKVWIFIFTFLFSLLIFHWIFINV